MVTKLPILPPDEALPIAEFCRPAFTQYLGPDNLYDFPTAIQLDCWYFEPNPPAYVSVCFNDEFYYIRYCWYHYRDVAGPGEPHISPFQHRHDFEGAMICVSRRAWDYVKKHGAPAVRAGINWSACRFHHHVKVQLFGCDHFGIEPYGHGIFADVDRDPKLSKFNAITYRDYPLIPLDEPRLRKYIQDAVAPAFRKEGVSLPWEWSDRRIHPENIWWDNPPAYLAAALERGIVKP